MLIDKEADITFLHSPLKLPVEEFAVHDKNLLAK